MARTMLAALSYALASYPLVFAAVLSWANPIMVARSDLVPMTAAHAVFGLALGATYLRARARWGGRWHRRVGATRRGPSP